MAGNANTDRPVDLRRGRETDLIFVDGLPPGAVVTVANEQESRGKRLRLHLPKSAVIVHRRKKRAEKSA